MFSGMGFVIKNRLGSSSFLKGTIMLQSVRLRIGLLLIVSLAIAVALDRRLQRRKPNGSHRRAKRDFPPEYPRSVQPSLG